MRQWFYCQNDKQVGPVSEEELVNLLRSGGLHPEALVWTEGQAEWGKATEMAALTPSSTTWPPPISTHGMSATGQASPTQRGEEGWSKSALLEVAKYQKYIQWLVLANLAAMLIPLGTIATAIVGVYFVYKLADSLRASNAWVYAILLFIPLIGLLTLVHFVVKATKVLRANGISVGVMGARMADFERLP